MAVRMADNYLSYFILRMVWIGENGRQRIRKDRDGFLK